MKGQSSVIPDRKRWSGKVLLSILLWLMLYLPAGCVPPEIPAPTPTPLAEVKLPEPRYQSDVSIEETLSKRRSVREYSGEPLTLGEVSQLLWAAQGTTDPRGFRTAPSAGGTYPLETYVAVGNVASLDVGVYRYVSGEHKLLKIVDEDCRAQLAEAAAGQSWIKEGAVIIVFTAIYERTTDRYGDRGTRYVHMEAGHAAQNVYLQAVALGLGTVVTGAFFEEQIREILKLPNNEQPLYIIPVGRAKN